MKGSLDDLMSSAEDPVEESGGLTDAAKDVREAIQAKDDDALASALQRFFTLCDEDDADDGPDEE